MAFSFLMVVPPAATQNIRIEIINLSWTVGVGHIPSSFNAKAILPDGAHAILICEGDEKACAGFQSFVPDNTHDSVGCDRERMVVTCTATALGFFPARREGNDVMIYVPKGKRKCRIVGSW